MASEGVLRSDAAALIRRIEEAEGMAHRIGMTRAAQALNRAKNEAGWELSDKLGAGRPERESGRGGSGEDGQ